MNTTVQHRGYDGAIVHDPDDQIYYGKVLGIRGIINYHGDTPKQAEEIFARRLTSILPTANVTASQRRRPSKNVSFDLPHEYQVKAALLPRNTT